MVCAPVRSIIPSFSPYRHTNHALSLTYMQFTPNTENCKIIIVKSCISIFVKFSHVRKGASRVVGSRYKIETVVR